MSGGSKVLLDKNSSEILSKLLGRIVHDFNNPLAAIIGFADLLRNPNLAPDKQARYVSRVYEQAVKLSQLVETMSYFSSSPEPAVAPIHLGRTVGEILTLREGGLTGAGIRVRTELPAEDFMVHGDRSAIGRILHALLNNAEQVFKENPLAEVREIGVFARREGDFGVVEVVDSGPGVPEDVAPYIFEPFYSTRRSGGLGLGLTISRGLAERMGGGLEQTQGANAPLTGALFCLRLPVAD